jgi:hypothetical protein
MAEIILSSDELVGILSANGWIPEPVAAVEIDGDEIGIRVRTPWPILKSLRVGMRFAGFENGHAVVQLVTNRLIDTFDWLVDRMLASLRLADHGGRWKYPRLYIDVNKLLQRQVRGVQITSVVLRDGRFHITTIPSVPSEPPVEAACDPKANSSSVTPVRA